MITGPEPMIRTDLGRAVAFTGCSRGVHAFQEAIKDCERVEGSGRSLGVVLDRLDGLGGVAQPLDRPIVEVVLADDEPRLGWQGVAHDLDLVVLRRHLDLPGLYVLDRVVRAVMAEAQAACLSSGRTADDLVTEADPKQRSPVLDRRLREARRTVEPCRVAGAWRHDETANIGRQSRGRVHSVRQHADASPSRGELSNDVLLEAVVHDRDERPVSRSNLVARVDRDLADKVLVLPARHVPSGSDGRGLVQLIWSANEDALRPG